MTGRTGSIGRTIGAAVIALVIGSCGGGGGDGGSSFGPSDQPGVSSGVITAFGSVFVNGVEWEIGGSTSITVDDEPGGTQLDLRVGQVVTVRGSVDSDGTTGEADTIEFDNDLEGPVASINVANGSFIVLGQLVITGLDTVFDDSLPDRFADGKRSLADLAVDDRVEVSGFRDALGAVRATRVEAGSAGAVEVRGTVSSFGATTLNLGLLFVNHEGANLENFEGDELGDGDLIEAEGVVVGGVLVATRIEREDDLTGEDGDGGEIEGFITAFVSATSFRVAGVPVTTDGGTEYDGGTALGLAENVKVEVEGETNSNGVLVADRIEFRVQPEETDIELAGDVASVDPSAGTVTLQAFDVLVRVTNATQLEDQSGAAVQPFSLADLAIGDYVEIHGAIDSGDDVIATRLERDDTDNEVILRGPVQFIQEPDLVILGVTVDTSFAVFLDIDDNPFPDANAFFTALELGDVVKVRATSAVVNEIDAFEIELEELN